MREDFFTNITANLCSCVTAAGDSRNISTLEAKSFAISDTFFNYEEKPRRVIRISEPTATKHSGSFFQKTGRKTYLIPSEESAFSLSESSWPSSTLSLLTAFLDLAGPTFLVGCVRARVVEFFFAFFTFGLASLAFSTMSCALRIDAGDGGGESIMYRVNYRKLLQIRNGNEEK